MCENPLYDLKLGVALINAHHLDSAVFCLEGVGASKKGSKLALDYGTFFEKAAYGQNGWKPP